MTAYAKIVSLDLRRGPRQAPGVQGLLQEPEPGERHWPLSLRFGFLDGI
jgi:hypothetical protein